MFSKRTGMSAFFLFLGILLSASPLAHAQLDTGSVTGTAMDPSRAVVSSAKITLKNVATGVELVTTTTASGVYAFSSVPVGEYTLSFEHDGFNSDLVKGIQVHVQKAETLDVKFMPASDKQMVEVNAASSLLQAEDAAVGQTIGTEMINDLPLNGRNWLSLGQLAAGAAMPSTSAPAIAGSPSGGTAQATFYSVNGANLWQNDVRLNGINDNIEVFGGGYAGSNAAVNPPPDGIQEFRMQNSNYNAEFGHSTGAVIDAVTKSGTNAIHGDLWEYLRNEDLQANDYFSNLNKKPRTEYRQNQYGGTVGGPVRIPKLYDGRDHTFFFFDYQGEQLATPAQTGGYADTVPTMNMRNSNFTNLQDLITANNSAAARKDGLGRNIPVGTILDPATTRMVAAGAVDPVTGLANTGKAAIYVRDPFLTTGSPAGVTDYTTMKSQLNVLPQSRIDPNAQKLLSLFPAPNATATSSNGFTNNYFYNPVNTESLNQYDIRIDENVRPKDALFVVFDKSYFNEVTPGKLPGLAIGQSGAQNQKFPSYMVSTGYVNGFTQHLFNEFHAGYSHSNKIQETFDGNTFGIPAQYGIQGIPQVPGNGGLTPVSIGALTGLGESGNRPTIQDVFDLTITDTVTYTHDKHSLHAGVQQDDIHGNIIQPQFSRGMFNFSGQFSDIPNLSSGFNGMADILLTPQTASLSGGVNNVGGITSYTGSAFNGSNYQRWFTGAFVQDDWKAMPTLTINLGLRWDFFTPYGDVRGRQANFVPNNGGNGPGGTYEMSLEGCQVHRSASFDALLASNGIALTCNANSRTGNAQKTNFGPRLGFAWRANDRLVVRGGYGITYGALANLGYNGTLGTNYPFVYTVSNSAVNSQTPLTLPNGQTGTMENTFGVLNLADPTLVNGAGVQLYGRQLNYQSPYVQSFNLAIQREMTAHDSLQVGYVGSVGRHLDILGATNNPSLILPVGTSVLAATGSTAPNYVPYPGFARGSIYESTNAMSNYNSMQTTFEHYERFGLSVLANYTYSRCMTNQRSPQNSSAAGYRAQYLAGFGINGDYGLCDSDSRHIVHFSEIYKLPVGRGMLFGSHMNRALDAVIGGWQVNGIVTYQTGQPFTVSCATATSADFGCFANKVQGQSLYPAQRTRLNWLNASAFVTPATAGTIGQTDYSVLGGGPDQARGPNYTNMDASLFKNFRFTQRWSAQFRIEAFNVFNHTQLGQPGSLNYTVPSTFAQITALRGAPRIAQVAGKIYF
jgi:hypothetical protein